MASVALDGGRFEVATEDLTRQGAWLVSRGYDLAFIILSCAFVVFPHLSYALHGQEHLRGPDGHAADRRPAPLRHLHHDRHGAALPRALAALHARGAAAAAADRDARDPEPDAAGDDLLPVGLGARDPPGRLRDRRLPHEGPARLGLDLSHHRLRPARDRDVPDRDREVHQGPVPDRGPHAAVPRVPEAAVGRLAGLGPLHRLRRGVCSGSRRASGARDGCTPARRC